MLAAAFPMRKIVAGGLDAANVAEAIRVARPWGVDASSRLESQPGRKDPVRVAQFVQAALTAFRQPQKVST
jgi:phosphoribosylanthranilate isomerase